MNTPRRTIGELSRSVRNTNLRVTLISLVIVLVLLHASPAYIIIIISDIFASILFLSRIVKGCQVISVFIVLQARLETRLELE